MLVSIGGMTVVELDLQGPAGEPIDLWRTLLSHGIASLPPMKVDEEAGVLDVTLRSGGRVRTVTVSPARRRVARVAIAGRRPSRTLTEAVVASVKHILRMDEDLSSFYRAVAADPELSWAAAGAGRMMRSASAFEDVVKTVCTTNCAWSATVRMVTALVAHLGEAAPGAPSGWEGRAFPTADAMASAGEDFYRDVVRAGYRGRYLIELATAQADGSIDLDELAGADRSAVSDDEMEAILLGLPGVGPYAAAHIMMMFGRYSRLILDSWTRPKFRRVAGMKSAKDATIVRRFKSYGPYAGLAFWLYLTRDWVDDGPQAPA